MEHLYRRYQQILCLCFAAGITLVSAGVAFDIGHMQSVVLTSHDPVPIFGWLCAMFGAAISCLRFGYEVIEQGISEQRADAARKRRLANPWTAPSEREAIRREGHIDR